MAGNTPKARAIGADIRLARKAAGLSQRDLAEKLGWKSHLKVHRAEVGEIPLNADELSTLLSAVDAPLELGTKLIDMTNDVHSAHWLAAAGTEQQRQLDALIELEGNAKKIVTVSPLLVAGLTQHPDYTRLILTDAGVPAGEIARRVAERQGRQQATILRREDPVEFCAYIDESVLDRTLGDAAVLERQRSWLLELGKLPNVDICVIPLDARWSAALETPFTLIVDADGQSVIHREDRLAGLFLHERPQVEAYEAALPKVAEVAMSPAESAELIAKRKSPTSTKETT